MPKNHNHFRTIWALNNNVDSKTPCTAIHISLQMKLETSNLVHGTWVIMPQPADDKPSLKREWSEPCNPL